MTERRIEKAKVLLTTTNDKIDLIALKTGYENTNSFSRMFKEKIGVSPNKYRVSARER